GSWRLMGWLIVDTAFEDLHGGAAKPDVLIGIVCRTIKANGKPAAFRDHFHVVVADFVVIAGEGAGGNAGAAGKGLVFHPALIGPDEDLVGPPLLHKVDVDALLCEVA